MRRGHVPIRTCRACRRKAPKQELARLVEVEGRLVDDARYVAEGHGVYCCRSGLCRDRLSRMKGKRRKNVASAALSHNEDGSKQ